MLQLKGALSTLQKLHVSSKYCADQALKISPRNDGHEELSTIFNHSLISKRRFYQLNFETQSELLVEEHSSLSVP
jgi:hypothetical protein